MNKPKLDVRFMRLLREFVATPNSHTIQHLWNWYCMHTVVEKCQWPVKKQCNSCVGYLADEGRCGPYHRSKDTYLNIHMWWQLENHISEIHLQMIELLIYLEEVGGNNDG